MIRLYRAAVLATLLGPLLLGGCGNKGPLYLPDPAAGPAAVQD